MATTKELKKIYSQQGTKEEVLKYYKEERELNNTFLTVEEFLAYFGVTK